MWFLYKRSIYFAENYLYHGENCPPVYMYVLYRTGGTNRAGRAAALPVFGKFTVGCPARQLLRVATIRKSALPAF